MLIHEHAELLDKHGKLQQHLADMRFDANEIIICLEKGKVELAIRLAKQLARRI